MPLLPSDFLDENGALTPLGEVYLGASTIHTEALPSGPAASQTVDGFRHSRTSSPDELAITKRCHPHDRLFRRPCNRRRDIHLLLHASHTVMRSISIDMSHFSFLMFRTTLCFYYRSITFFCFVA